MNTKWLVLPVVMGALAAAPRIRAADVAPGHHEEAEGAKVAAPSSLAGVLHEIKEHQEELHKLIGEGKLANVHEVAFTIRDMANELPKYSKDLPAENSKKLTAWLAGVADSAGKLDEFGDAGDKPNAEKEAKRLDVLLGSIEKLYPADAQKAAAYTCPMHPDVVTQEPGKCPKCGMNLVAKKADEPAAKKP